MDPEQLIVVSADGARHTQWAARLLTLSVRAAAALLPWYPGQPEGVGGIAGWLKAA